MSLRYKELICFNKKYLSDIKNKFDKKYLSDIKNKFDKKYLYDIKDQLVFIRNISPI